MFTNRHHGNTVRLVMDAETYSEVDLAKAGAHAYAEHPSTGVHVFKFMLKCRQQVLARATWTPASGWLRALDPETLATKNHLAFGGLVVAHNWLFEFCIWHEIMVKRPSYAVFDALAPIALDRWSCTMARALYHGLPAGLDMLGEALALPVVKDKSARANMLKLAKPRSRDPLTGKATWWHDDPDVGPAMLAKNDAYCEQDVEVEAFADDVLPELPPYERRVFEMDARINLRGMAVDDVFVDALQTITTQQQGRINAELFELTDEAVKTINQTKALTEWLSGRGVDMAAMTKGDVALALARPNMDDTSRAVLALRQEGAKASTAKLRSMVAAWSNDGRARGLLQYYGAGRTGRWAGRRIQKQNFPRGHLKPAQLAWAIEGVRNKGWTAEDLDLLMPGTPMDVVASLLRGCLTAGADKAVVSVDLSQIEARVLAWLAGQDDVLIVFARGDDVYTYTANKIGSKDRQMGKVLVLACGFGMGKDRFQETALTYKVVLTLEQAEDLVRAWREANPKIVSFWYELDAVFRRVAESPNGYAERVGSGPSKLAKLLIRKTGKAVRIKLSNRERELVYQDVQIVPDDEDAPDGRTTITYMGMNQKTNKWERIRTYGGKLAENVTQAVARDVMVDKLLTIENTVDGLDVIGSVHDEGLCGAALSQAQAMLDKALAIFRAPVSWAPGLPIGAEGWWGERYRKG